MKLVLFDVDGTLVHSCGAGKRASDRAFEESFGVAQSWGGVSAAGRTDPLIFGDIAARVLGREMLENEYTALIALYEKYLVEELERSDSTALLPGVETLLETLTDLPSVLIGLQTGNLEACAWAKLRRCGVHHHFSFGGFALDLRGRETIVARAAECAAERTGRPFSPSEVVVVGDTPYDIEAGKHFGALTIGVATGSFPVAELEKCEPDAVFSNLSETATVLRAMGLTYGE